MLHTVCSVQLVCIQCLFSVLHAAHCTLCAACGQESGGGGAAAQVQHTKRLYPIRGMRTDERGMMEDDKGIRRCKIAKLSNFPPSRDDDHG